MKEIDHMKIQMTFLLFLFSLQAMSQSADDLYFDDYLRPVEKRRASTYGKVSMDSGLYKLSVYSLKKKNLLKYEAWFADSARKIHVKSSHSFFDDGSVAQTGNYVTGNKEGLWKIYWNPGKLGKEIMYRDGFPVTCTTYHNLADIGQRLVLVDDVPNNILHATIYDQQARIISDERIPQDYTDLIMDADIPPIYPGGSEMWNRYIGRAVKTKINDLIGERTSQVIIRFVIDTSGNITDIRALTMPDSPLAAVGIKALKKSSKWEPAQDMNGNKTKMVMFQPLTVRGIRN